ncbi:MAG: hypothetical protein ACOYD7_00145 [Raoultibacter sp.]|jgi:hypothetical protein
MKNDDGFSIISVSADDDEIVIQAGITEKPPLEEEPNDVVAQAPAAASEAESSVQTELVEHAPVRKKEVYQGVTKEDLEVTGPFQKMRVVILVCGLLLLVGFIVYFMFLR